MRLVIPQINFRLRRFLKNNNIGEHTAEQINTTEIQLINVTLTVHGVQTDRQTDRQTDKQTDKWNI